jgi:hypothetical protein
MARNDDGIQALDSPRIVVGYVDSKTPKLTRSESSLIYFGYYTHYYKANVVPSKSPSVAYIDIDYDIG